MAAILSRPQWGHNKLFGFDCGCWWIGTCSCYGICRQSDHRGVALYRSRKAHNRLIFQNFLVHGDVIKWKPFLNNWTLCGGNPAVYGGLPSQRPVTWSFILFISTWTNGWANNREASDLWHHHAHYDVNVIFTDSANTIISTMTIAQN